jgi:thiol-disulfide isomerase/thioredoxin
MADQTYCQNCAGANPPDAKFCATCGVAFVSAAASPPDTAPSESPSTRQPLLTPQLESQLTLFLKAVGVTLLVLALFVLLIYGIVLFAPHSQESSAPAYTFETGVNHPQEIKNLMRNDTVVLYVSENNCPACDDMTPRMADLQSHYKDGTFAHINVDDNASSMNTAKNYGIQWVPAVLVIRGDGAVAKFIAGSGAFTFTDNTAINNDINAVKSAIQEAQAWQQSHIR